MPAQHQILTSLLLLLPPPSLCVSPSQMSQIVWWLSFVTATTEDGFVESSADLCSSNQSADLHHPADVLTWQCECATTPLLAKSSAMDVARLH